MQFKAVIVPAYIARTDIGSLEKLYTFREQAETNTGLTHDYITPQTGVVNQPPGWRRYG